MRESEAAPRLTPRGLCAMGESVLFKLVSQGAELAAKCLNLFDCSSRSSGLGASLDLGRGGGDGASPQLAHQVGDGGGMVGVRLAWGASLEGGSEGNVDRASVSVRG